MKIVQFGVCIQSILIVGNAMQMSLLFPYASRFGIAIPDTNNPDHAGIILNAANQCSGIECDVNPYNLEHIQLLNPACNDNLTACELLFRSVYGYSFHVDPVSLLKVDMSEKFCNQEVGLCLRVNSSLASLRSEFNEYNRSPFVMSQPTALELLHFVDSIALNYDIGPEVKISIQPLFQAADMLHVGIEIAV